MRDRNHAVRKSIPPPVAMDVDDAGKVPGVAPISDDGSVDFLLFSRASESEGENTKERSDYEHPPLSCVGMPGVCSRSKTSKQPEAS